MNEVSHQYQHEVIPTRRKLNGWAVTQQSATHHELDRNARLDVPDFSGDQNIEVFLDWLHSIKTFFDWYDVLEIRKF